MNIGVPGTTCYFGMRECGPDPENGWFDARRFLLFGVGLNVTQMHGSGQVVSEVRCRHYNTSKRPAAPCNQAAAARDGLE